jgi:hypothetical protein
MMVEDLPISLPQTGTLLGAVDVMKRATVWRVGRSSRIFRMFQCLLK